MINLMIIKTLWQFLSFIKNLIILKEKPLLRLSCLFIAFTPSNEEWSQ